MKQLVVLTLAATCLINWAGIQAPALAPKAARAQAFSGTKEEMIARMIKLEATLDELRQQAARNPDDKNLASLLEDAIREYDSTSARLGGDRAPPPAQPDQKSGGPSRGVSDGVPNGKPQQPGPSVINAGSATVLTLEGLQNQEPVNEFYNGGTGGNGSGPGPNVGVSFTSTSLALIDADAGGTGNFGGEPSPSTGLFFLSGSAIMNVPAGFTTGFSFFYSAINSPGSVSVFSGPNGTGTLLTTLALPLTPNNGAPDPTGQFSPLVPIGVAFVGTAMSVDFGGTVNQTIFDDVTIGSATPGGGGGNPVPTCIPEVEPNNTPGTAQVLTSAENCFLVCGAITPVGDQDYFRVNNVPANSKAWFYADTGGTNAPPNSTDSFITIFAADGTTVIEEDDDDGIGWGCDGSVETDLSSSVSGRTLTAGGTYFFQVRNFSPSDVIDRYQMFLVLTPSTLPVPEVESNNTTGTANPIVTGAQTTGVRSATIGVAGDIDVYSIVATAGNILFISADTDPPRDGSETDVVLELLGPDGTTVLQLMDQTNASEGSEVSCFNISTTGTYFVRVTSPQTSGEYQLMVAACQGPCILTCPANITVSNDPNQCGAVVNYPAPQTTGTCGTITCSPASGSFFPVGTTTVTCTETGPVPITVTTVYSSGNINVRIPETDSSGTMVPQMISVADPGTITDINFRFRANHTFDGDLSITLTGPNSSTVSLVENRGGSGDNFGTGATDCSGTETVLDDEAATPIAAGAAPFAGSFQPEAPLSAFDGLAAACTWTLMITDEVEGDTGTLFCWELEITRSVPGVGATCSFLITVVDTQPPTISCPGNVTAVTNQNVCPAPACQTVDFPPPTASDNCPGVTVACNPPAGSCFAVGVTTVTCTATDASGNTVTCSFTVTTFDTALQDDSDPSIILLWNSLTGAYRFCCKGVTYTGVGTSTIQGCIFTLQHNPADRRVLGRVDKAVHRGTASIQAPPGTIRCTITDRNTLNDTPVCQ